MRECIRMLTYSVAQHNIYIIWIVIGYGEGCYRISVDILDVNVTGWIDMQGCCLREIEFKEWVGR